MRTYNKEIVKKALTTYAEEIVGLDLEDWLANPLNIALTNSVGDVAMFENQSTIPGAVCGHYFFFSRGRDAIQASKRFLHELFTKHYPEVVIGITPVEHRAALWMNRQIGFKEYGTLETEIGPCKFVLLTKDQWQVQNELVEGTK